MKKLKVLSKVATPSINEPSYRYRIKEFATTFEGDVFKSKPYEFLVDFRGDLIQCRKQAITYLRKRTIELEHGSYILPFASPEDFVLGKHAAYSISLSLVEYFDEEHQEAYSICGEEDTTIEEGLEFEALVYQKLGLLLYDSNA